MSHLAGGPPDGPRRPAPDRDPALDETATHAAYDGREVVADYDLRSPASRTLVTVVGTIVAFVVIAGVFLLLSRLTLSTHTETARISGEATQGLVLTASQADVTVVPGSGDDIVVTAAIHKTFTGAHYQLGRQGDRIIVDSSCHKIVAPWCGVKVTVRVPRGYPVDVTTGSGDLALSGLGGSVKVQSDAGDVSTTGLSVDEIDAATTSGDIRLGFAKRPYSIKASSGSGDVDVTLPGGSRTYVVQATSKSGDVHKGVPTTKGGGLVRLSSDSGDVSITQK